MSDFSDKDDLELFRLAKMFVDAGNKVDWDYICKQMKKTKKSRQQLQGRLKTMKQRWGVDLNAFPSRFLNYKRVTNAGTSCHKSKGPRVERSSQANTSAATGSKPPSAPFACMTETDAWRAVHQLFGSVPAAVVRQTNNTYHNVGEIVPRSVSKIIDLLRMNEDDVFVDVGAGIGNVAVQVVLETNIKLSIAVEMRENVRAS